MYICTDVMVSAVVVIPGVLSYRYIESMCYAISISSTWPVTMQLGRCCCVNSLYLGRFIYRELVLWLLPSHKMKIPLNSWNYYT